MTSKLKCPYTEEELKEIRNNFKGDKPICPFCQQELVREGMNHWWCLCNLKHQGKELYGTTALWQALIQSQQDLEESQQATLENAQTILEIHKDLEQSEKCCSAWEVQALDYHMKTIALSGDLEIAKSALRQIESRLVISPEIVARKALEQIEHKE